MKKGDWFKYMVYGEDSKFSIPFKCMVYGEDSKFSIPFKCTETTRCENKPNIIHFDNIDGDNVEVSEGVCKKLTRKEVMQIAKKRIAEICEEFELWTGGDGEIECPSAVLICKKTKQRIEI